MTETKEMDRTHT